MGKSSPVMFRTAIISMFITTSALADTWTVDDDGKADFDNIQAAVDAASDGDEIVVMPGTYTSTQDGHVVNMLGKAVTLRSSDPNDPDVVAATIVDGEGARRGIACFNEETSSTLIDGFTITNGFAGVFDYDGDSEIDWFEDGGGGLFCWKSSPTAKNCIIDNNHVIGDGLEGGGAILVESNPSLQNCVLSNNSASWGGAMYCWASSPSIIDCSFIDNNASSAGGIRCKASSNLTLTNTIFINNIVDNDGGAIHCDTSLPTLTNCSFFDNIAGDDAGAIFFFDSDATVTNCQFESNRAADEGGAIICSESNPLFTNCLFTGNSVVGVIQNGGGGGIFNWYSDPVIVNCNFVSNTVEPGKGNGFNVGGGGMFNWGSDPLIEDCNFIDNSIMSIHATGGGIFNYFSAPTLIKCQFASNMAWWHGGGMANWSSNSILETCRFINNNSFNGGGISNNQSTTLLASCTFSSNIATGEGGGVHNYARSNLVIENCSFTGNSATTGDGIYNVYDSSTYFAGRNTSDGLHNDLSSLEFSAESTCDVFGSTILSSDGTISFDIDAIETSSSLNVSQSIDQSGGLVISNNSGSLLEATKENVGDRIPLAQASALFDNFDSIVFPLMPEGLGLQLINPALRGGGSEVAAEVIEVEGANFGDPFSGGLDSPPIDIISFDADGDGRDEVAVLFGGTPGGVAGYSVSQDGTPTPIDGLVAIVGNDPVSIDAADLNNDGREDLIVANSTDNSISVLLTMEDIDGSLYFDVTTTPMARGDQLIACVAAIDWDGDTDLDAVVGVDGVNSGYQVLLNVSDTMSSGPWFAVPNFYPPNSPGLPDQPTCVDGGNQSGGWGFVGGTRHGRVHRGTSDDSFQVIAELAGNNTVTIKAIELDANGGDGQIDLMVSSDEAEVIYLFQGNAAESDGFDDLIPLGVSLPVEDIIALDADGDGDMDIVMTAPDSDTPVILLRNDGVTGLLPTSLPGLTWSMQIVNSASDVTRLTSGGLEGKDDEDDWIVGGGSSTAFRGETIGVIEQSNILLGSRCDADVSGDGVVNVTDLLAVIDQWGSTDSDADINGDGIVNVTDLLEVVGSWGPCE